MARLTAVQIDQLIQDTRPAPGPSPHAGVTTDDYAAERSETRDQLFQSLTSQSSSARARDGELLPPPPKSLVASFHDSGPIVDEKPIPTALRGVDLKQIKSRAELMWAITQNLPLNEYQLPKLIFRPDLLDYNLFCDVSDEAVDLDVHFQEMQDALDVATIQLQYTEGFPALPDGAPLWSQFSFEDKQAFDAFTAYVLQPGARQTAKLMDWPQDTIQKWFHENYWALRAKCYDMMHAIHNAKVREQRILGCEDKHYRKIDNLMQRMDNLEETVDWQQLASDPKEYVNVLEKLVKLQRTILGLGNMAQTSKEVKSESTELVLRNMTRDTEPELKGMKDDSIDVRALLRNPQALGAAQELIVRMTRTTQTIVPQDINTPTEQEDAITPSGSE
jgi:hypothetical protein